MHEISCVDFKEDTAKECAVIQKDRSLWDDVMWTNEMTSLEETCHHIPPGGITRVQHRGLTVQVLAQSPDLNPGEMW